MDSRSSICRFSFSVLLFFLLFAVGCSLPSWFPIKKAPPHKAKMKELVDKEVLIIDRVEYVKVVNPKATPGSAEPKYLYVPVDEYLASPSAYTSPLVVAKAKEGPAKDFSGVAATAPVQDVVPVSRVNPALSRLKKKVVIAYLDDQVTESDESVGDWLAENLAKELDRRSGNVLLVDYAMIKDFVEKRGLPLSDLETPKVLHLLNEVFGINALVAGHLAGPYVFPGLATPEKEDSASAILKIEVRVYDTLSGKTPKVLAANNPVFATKVKGSFPEERAKLKAMEIALTDLGRQLSRELETLDWSCRVVHVEGAQLYLNAGKMTGLRVGDILEVFPPPALKANEEPKAQIQVSGFLGLDVSVGKPLNGSPPDVSDVLKPAKQGAR